MACFLRDVYLHSGTELIPLFPYLRAGLQKGGGGVCVDRISNCPLDRVLTYKNLIYLLNLQISTEVLIIMSSPGQKRGTCGHIMAVFNGHLKCARYWDKGAGDKLCVLKRDCTICKAFTPEQIQQLATPTYRDRKNKDKKTVSAPTPTLMDPSQVNVLGRVEGEKVVKQPETTPAGKKKRVDESLKASKRKPSSRPSTDDLKNLYDKWALQGWRLCCLQSPLQSQRTSGEACQKPFFDPGASTSQKSTGFSDVSVTGSSHIQATGEVPVKATQAVETPSTRRGYVIQQNAIQPVEAPGTGPESRASSSYFFPIF